MAERRPAIVICCDGRVRVEHELDASLENLQRIVRGYITCIDLDERTQRLCERQWNVALGKRPCLVANDDAIALQLPVNPVASVLYSMVCGEAAAIFGPCVVVDCP